MAWDITGNNGTNPNDNFLGTIDNEPLVIRTHNANVMRISEDGKLVIVTGSGFDPVIPYTWFTVTAEHATPDIGTKEVMRIMRHGVPGVVNQNSASFCLGAFEPGIEQRSRLDIKVAGLPNNSNVWGSVPDVTVMSLQGDGNVGIGTTNPFPQRKLDVQATGTITAVAGYSEAGFGVAGTNDGGVPYSGVYGFSSSATGIGVSGYAPYGTAGVTGSGLKYGVTGSSGSGTGVLGTVSGDQSAVVGISGNQQQHGFGAGVYGNSFAGTGVSGYSNNGFGIEGGSANSWCGYFHSSGGSSKGVYVSVPAGQPGLQVASGTKSAIVPTSQGSRSLYTEEATEVWFTIMVSASFKQDARA
ncbi:MAG: hypothetical protein M3178_05240 [Pseudomonadota bacterium]|nr:hypothetical protein [Pseudomonadota bacterium]